MIMHENYLLTGSLPASWGDPSAFPQLQDLFLFDGNLTGKDYRMTKNSNVSMSITHLGNHHCSLEMLLSKARTLKFCVFDVCILCVTECSKAAHEANEMFKNSFINKHQV